MFKGFAYSRLLLASVAATVLFAGSADAGFEWKGPSAPPAAVAAPASNASNAYPEPVIMWDGNTDGMPAQKIGAVEAVPMASSVPSSMPPSGPVELAPSSAVLLPKTDVTPVVSPVAPAALADGGDVVTGFGSDLPLAIALQQIAPVGYQFSFGVGVNPGTAVSWEGGKPWKTVLNETLSARGYTYVITGNVIRVLEQRDLGMPAASFAAAPVALSPDVPPSLPPALPNVTGLETIHVTQQLQGKDADAVIKAPADPISIRRQKPSVIHKVKNFTNRLGTEKPAENVSDKTVEPAKAAEKEMAPAAKAAAPVSSPIEWDQPAMNVAPEPAQDNFSAAPMNITRDSAVFDAPMPMMSQPPVPVRAAPPAAVVNDSMMAPLDIAPVKEAVPPVTSGISMAADTAAPGTVAPATWHGARGQTLRDVLKSWSDVAGVELYWSIDYDYRLQQDAAYPGSYDEAVGHLLDLFATVRPQPYGQLHQENGNGSRVLVIKSYDLAK